MSLTQRDPLKSDASVTKHICLEIIVLKIKYISSHSLLADFINFSDILRKKVKIVNFYERVFEMIFFLIVD